VHRALGTQREEVHVQVRRAVRQQDVEDVDVAQQAAEALVKVRREVDVDEDRQQLQRRVLVHVHDQQQHGADRRERLQVAHAGVLPRERAQQPAERGLVLGLPEGLVNDGAGHILRRCRRATVRRRVLAAVPAAVSCRRQGAFRRAFSMMRPHCASAASALGVVSASADATE